MADGERRRRSSRLIELDACKDKQAPSVQAPPEDDSPPQDTIKKRGRRKRRLEEVLDEGVVASVSVDNNINNFEQAGEISKHEGDPHSTDQPLSAISPEKRLLELVLDILQRRDTYDIFAEPVKPEEVKGYYDIIKNPMDFGTMRAKLHEGMYASLEQFEHDVFLIFNNAMHFNASTTIYFRQARAIGELAKKVFRALRVNPENFEVEFLTKQKPSRRPRGEDGSLHIGSIQTLATNLETSGTATDTNTKSINRPRSLNDPSSQTTPGPSTSTLHYIRAYDNLPGSRDGKGTNLYEAERRSTGKSWTSCLSEDESISSTVYNSSKPLVPVNQMGVGYKESLMRFVSDLGPTAQNVANRKLQQCQVQAKGPNSQFPAPNSQVPAIPTQQGPTPMNGLISAGTSSYFLDKLRKDIGSPLRLDVVHQTPISEIQLSAYHRTAGTGDLNFSSVGMMSSSSGHSTMMMDPSKSGSWVQPTELDSQSRLPRFMPRNNDWPSQELVDGSGSSQAATFEQGFISHNSNREIQPMTAPCPSYGVGSSVQGSKDPGCSQPKTEAVQSVLDLSYLQSRLNELNSSKQGRVIQPGFHPGLAPGTVKPAFNGESSQQRAPGHILEAGPSTGGHPFSARSFQERAQLHSYQAELRPRESSFNAFSFPGIHPTELSAEELSSNALFHERTPVQSYPAELGAEGLYLDAMSFDERTLGARRPSFNELPSPRERSLPDLPVYTHQAEPMSSIRGLSSDAKRLHERATAHSLQTEMMSSPRGLYFNAASLQQRAPVRLHEDEPSAPVLSFNEVSLHERAALHGQQAEPSSGVLSFNTLSLHERAALHGQRAERGSSSGLHFDEVGFHHELNPVSEEVRGLSVNAPMSFHERPPAVIALQAQVSRVGRSSNALGFHQKPPVLGHQAELATRAFLENQQSSQQPDLDLQL